MEVEFWIDFLGPVCLPSNRFVNIIYTIDQIQIRDHYNVLKDYGDGNINHSEKFQTGLS